MRGLLDERGRILGRVNVVDALVLVIIIGLLLFAVSRSASCADTTSNTPIRVTLSIQKISNDVANSIEKSWRTGTVLSSQGGASLGTVKSIKVTKTLEEDMTPGGQMNTFASSINSDVTVVIAGAGLVSRDSVSIGGKSIMIGDTFVTQGGKASAQATVVDVSWGAEAGK